MMEQYSLPPGYRYELLPGDEDGAWFGILDRADAVVMSIPLAIDWLLGFCDAIKTIWRILESSPELAGVHTAAFMVWRLNSSPLDRIDK